MPLVIMSAGVLCCFVDVSCLQPTSITNVSKCSRVRDVRGFQNREVVRSRGFHTERAGIWMFPNACKLLGASDKISTAN
jgi:hypothetical protein